MLLLSTVFLPCLLYITLDSFSARNEIGVGIRSWLRVGSDVSFIRLKFHANRPTRTGGTVTQIWDQCPHLYLFRSTATRTEALLESCTLSSVDIRTKTALSAWIKRINATSAWHPPSLEEPEVALFELKWFLLSRQFTSEKYNMHIQSLKVTDWVLDHPIL